MGYNEENNIINETTENVEEVVEDKAEEAVAEETVIEQTVAEETITAEEIAVAEEKTEEVTEVVDTVEVEKPAETADFSPELEIEQEVILEAKPKKKFPLQVPVIIAACILVGALVAYLLINFFTPTVEGTWLYESEDGFSFYYTFDENAQGNIVDMSIGTVHFPGTYEVIADDTASTISISVYAGYIYGDYTYELTGNRLSGNRTLTLVGSDGTSITLPEAKRPKDKDYISPDENFEKVDALVGEWEYEYEEYGASLKLTINADGTLVYDQFGYQELHCVYIADDSTVTLTFFETETISQQEEYYFEGDDLVFLGVKWSKVGSSTADEA